MFGELAGALLPHQGRRLVLDLPQVARLDAEPTKASENREITLPSASVTFTRACRPSSFLRSITTNSLVRLSQTKKEESPCTVSS